MVYGLEGDGNGEVKVVSPIARFDFPTTISPPLPPSKNSPTLGIPSSPLARSSLLARVSSPYGMWGREGREGGREGEREKGGGGEQMRIPTASSISIVKKPPREIDISSSSTINHHNFLSFLYYLSLLPPSLSQRLIRSQPRSSAPMPFPAPTLVTILTSAPPAAATHEGRGRRRGVGATGVGDELAVGPFSVRALGLARRSGVAVGAGAGAGAFPSVPVWEGKVSGFVDENGREHGKIGNVRDFVRLDVGADLERAAQGLSIRAAPHGGDEKMRIALVPDDFVHAVHHILSRDIIAAGPFAFQEIG